MKVETDFWVVCVTVIIDPYNGIIYLINWLVSQLVSTNDYLREEIKLKKNKTKMKVFFCMLGVIIIKLFSC